MTGRGLLTLLVEVLEELQRIVPDDKAAWDADRLTRLAAERLWITAGNVAEAYRRDVLGAEVGTEPWPEARRLPPQARPRVAWRPLVRCIYADTVADLPRLLEQVGGRRQGVPTTCSKVVVLCGLIGGTGPSTCGPTTESPSTRPTRPWPTSMRSGSTPTPKSESGSSIRVIGYCPSRREILTVILVRESGVDWLSGANGWPANSTDRAKYRQGSE